MLIELLSATTDEQTGFKPLWSAFIPCILTTHFNKQLPFFNSYLVLASSLVQIFNQ